MSCSTFPDSWFSPPVSGGSVPITSGDFFTLDTGPLGAVGAMIERSSLQEKNKELEEQVQLLCEALAQKDVALQELREKQAEEAASPLLSCWESVQDNGKEAVLLKLVSWGDDRTIVGYVPGALGGPIAGTWDGETGRFRSSDLGGERARFWFGNLIRKQP